MRGKIDNELVPVVNDHSTAVLQLGEHQKRLVIVGLGIVAVIAIILIIMGWKRSQDKRRIDEEHTGLTDMVFDLEAKLDHTRGRVDSLEGRADVVERVVIDLRGTVKILMDLSTKGFRPMKGNPTLQQVVDLEVGQDPLVMRFFWKGKVYAVSFWKEAGVPLALVKASIMRNAESGQLVDPIAIRHLYLKVFEAIKDGRVLPEEKGENSIVQIGSRK